MGDLSARIAAAVGHVADFPVPGFPFRDVTPVFENDARLFKDVVDTLAARVGRLDPDCIVAVESFGYVFGAPLAYLLERRLALARRAGKLPRPTFREDYDMIYAPGKALELHRDGVRDGDRVVVLDDVLASGGSALAAVRLIERAGARCVGLAVLAEAPVLRGMPPRVELDRADIEVIALSTLEPPG